MSTGRKRGGAQSWTDINRDKRGVPDGLWIRCDGCNATVLRREVDKRAGVCPEPGCGHHFYISAPRRIETLLDPDSFEEWFTELKSLDPLGFTDRKPYAERLVEEQKRTGLREACITGRGYLRGRPLVCAVTDSAFIMGSMGSVVGEKLTRLIETATARRIPVLIVCASGGARMQEGMLSLMQMAKISGALERHRQAELLYLPLLTYPTTGGVTASFAMLGDLILAEPKALIGFAGRRVIEQTLREKLPEGFQTAEYLRDHGFVDAIVDRTEFKATLASLLTMHGCRETVAA